MTISEKKMQIVIDNYFKSECNVNTSIRQAFEKGFRIGVKKGSYADVSKRNVGDTISRQETLHAFEEMCSCTDYGWDERDFRDLIKKVPSAEPQFKNGKWIHDNSNTFKCSKCNKYLGISCGNMKMNFCPNCGADMRGEQDED